MSRNNAFLLGGAFCCMAALGMVTVLVPLRMLDHGRSVAEIGVVVAVASMFQLVARPLAGTLCDHFGGCRILLLSYAGVAVCSAGLMLSTSLAALLASKAVTEASGGVFRPAASLCGSRSAPTRLPQIFGYYTSVTSAGNVVGKLAAGCLALYVGFPAGFAVAAGTGVLGMCSGS